MRTRSLTTTLTALALATLALGACETAESQPAEPDIPSASETIGAAGGTLSSAGVQLTVPSGAVADPTLFSLEAVDAPEVIDGFRRVWPVIEVQPAGTAFTVPAELTLPVDPARLPESATLAQVVVRVAPSVAGPWETLPTTPDVAEGRVTAPIDHLSVFAAMVREPAAGPGPADPPACLTYWENCGCEQLLVDRPIETVSVELTDRRTFQSCYDESANELTVLSRTFAPDSVFGDPPISWHLTVMDGDTLATLDDTVTDQTSLPDSCFPPGPQKLSGDDRSGLTWSASVFQVDPDAATGVDSSWFQERIAISVDGVSRELTMNTFQNDAGAYPDQTDTLDSALNEVRVRALPGGGVRAYFMATQANHIDIAQVGNWASWAPTAPKDATGRTVADVYERIQYGTRPQALATGTSIKDPDHVFYVAPDADDPSVDILALTDLQLHVVGYRVHVDATSQAVVVQELGQLGMADPDMALLNHAPLGLGSDGRLWLATDGASFTTAAVAVLDLGTWTLDGEWAIGCLTQPYMDGASRVLPDHDDTLYIVSNGLDSGTDLAWFVRNGAILGGIKLPEAAGFPTFASDRAYLFEGTSTVTRMAIPD